MTDEQQPTTSDPEPNSNLTQRDPDEWVTGEEPATEAQMSYLSTLAAETRTEVPADLSKADASKMIEELQGKSPRLGTDAG